MKKRAVSEGILMLTPSRATDVAVLEEVWMAEITAHENWRVSLHYGAKPRTSDVPGLEDVIIFCGLHAEPALIPLTAPP
jgi:hypothetical protein